jgi:hypothetical protein
MAAKKPKKVSSETAWKIAAIDRLIEQQHKQIAALKAKIANIRKDSANAHVAALERKKAEILRASAGANVAGLDEKIAIFKRSVAESKRHPDLPKPNPAYYKNQLADALDRLDELKAQKRKPSTLLTLGHLLLDDGLERTKQVERQEKFPAMFEKRHPGLLAALKAEQRRINVQHFEGNKAQREKAAQPRPRPVDASTEYKAKFIENVIAKLLKYHRDDTPNELWPQLHDELWETCSDHAGALRETTAHTYKYNFGMLDDGKIRTFRDTLTYTKFCKILRELRDR